MKPSPDKAAGAKAPEQAWVQGAALAAAAGEDRAPNCDGGIQSA